MKLFLSFSFIIFICFAVSSQTLQSPKSEVDTTLYEKLYLHIDREFFSPGDDIWFKSYLVSGINHRLIPGFKNVYVQLVADDGRIIDQQIMLSVYGVSNNDFHLPDTLPTGQYTIRAYTKYLLNFDEESLFHQKIAVSRTTDLPEGKENQEENNITDISFLPEGGNLVMNAANYIAFKAIDKSGKGFPVTGKVVDETGREVATFESTYRGMGRFVLMPQEGKKYIAQIDGYAGLRFQFEDARFDGVALHYQTNGDNLQFILNRNFTSVGTRNLTMTASHKGKLLFQETIEMKDFQHAVTVYKGFFPPGISKITLLDEQENILAERLIFVRNSGERNLMITSDKKEYQPREKIELQLESLLDSEEDSIIAGLSLAVVNEDYFSMGGKSQSIESYLLLDSELKGPLESPASCFTDEENITSDEKLDLVMMVNGWRRYYWDELKDNFDKPLEDWNDTGLTIEGEVKTLWGGKPVSGGTVELGPFSSQFLILKDTTDDWGRFRFHRVFLRDSAHVMINTFNTKGRQRNVEVTYRPAQIFDSAVSAFKLNRVAQPVEKHEGFQESSFRRHLAEREFILEHGSILLGEVDVIEEYRTGPVVTGTRGFRDREFTLSDKDKEYYNILRYLEFEVPGVFVEDDESVRLALTDQFPVFFVDDVWTPFDIVRNLSMDEIVKVEIFNPQIKIGLLGDWNSSGLPKDGGVISILTTNRFGKFSDTFVRNIHGRIVPRIQGFRQAREFYSPQYPLAEEDAIEKPDQRPTLFWEPFVLLENGKKRLEFHTSDMTGQYRVIAEGISAKGKIIHSSALVNVAVPAR